ncbi:MAG: acetylxylan esterase [Cyclobacteriaceae bacterium]|nr:acetylxylan esterase [Cyclobacteriaceae bacterium]
MKFFNIALCILMAHIHVSAQVIYDEDKVPAYQLPGILESQSVSQWESDRRPELLRLFETTMYGRFPSQNITVSFEVTDTDPRALAGKAIRKNVVMSFSKGGKTVTADLLLYLPAGSSGPVPVFLGMNFYGNHTIQPDPGIPITQSFVLNSDEFNIRNNTATEASRGVRVGRWPVEQLIDRGYGLATIFYGDLDPDFDDGFQNGVHALLDKGDGFEPGELSAISAWSYGLSTAMDYLVTDTQVDAAHVAVIGHSRLGKAALWAGALDQRFSMVISNNSGCGGAALSRRRFGETVERINTQFPHWFCDAFTSFNNRENELPIDQHMLLALLAPRPVYVASAEEDQWADPRGEYLSLYHASEVYKCYGESGIGSDEMPGVNAPLRAGSMGYHIRTGAHDLTGYDWAQYLEFADYHWKRK